MLHCLHLSHSDNERITMKNKQKKITLKKKRNALYSMKCVQI